MYRGSAVRKLNDEQNGLSGGLFGLPSEAVPLPVVQNLNGTQLAADYEGVIAVEIHY
ncbi:MAG: hypothetical protein GXO96_06220 [Nitrospirae bacterium]|nr:hypothetical protein [Candidatus Manganitrophaceae bacterium]